MYVCPFLPLATLSPGPCPVEPVRTVEWQPKRGLLAEPLTRLPVHNSQTLFILFPVFKQRLWSAPGHLGRHLILGLVVGLIPGLRVSLVMDLMDRLRASLIVGLRVDLGF